MNRPIRTLLFSTLYPSVERPLHGIFVETRLRELLKTGGVESRVVAPVPWFPSGNDRWGAYATFARTPRQEHRNGIGVQHPRYPLPPKVGMTASPMLLALACLPLLRRMQRDGVGFDLIDAHYFYPDGVAAALLARWLAVPLAITARGSDLTVIPKFHIPGRMIQWAAKQADAAVGVSTALVDVLRGWGIEASRLHVLRNGVDLERFQPNPVVETRRRLGIAAGPVLLSVGRLVELKGHHLVVEALKTLRLSHPDARLHIIGEGPERGALEQLVRRLRLEDCVTLQGAVPQQQLPDWYSAADLLVLASSSEGWANVLLESMACGTPVVATRNWGTPEVVGPGSHGLLVEQRSADDLAAAFKLMLSAPPRREDVRSYACKFSWKETSLAQLDLFAQMLQARGAVV